jgi:hypothetical protein
MVADYGEGRRRPQGSLIRCPKNWRFKWWQTAPVTLPIRLSNILHFWVTTASIQLCNQAKHPHHEKEDKTIKKLNSKHEKRVGKGERGFGWATPSNI